MFFSPTLYYEIQFPDQKEFYLMIITYKKLKQNVWSIMTMDVRARCRNRLLHERFYRESQEQTEDQFP